MILMAAVIAVSMKIVGVLITALLIIPSSGAALFFIARTDGRNCRDHRCTGGVIRSFWIAGVRHAGWAKHVVAALIFFLISIVPLEIEIGCRVGSNLRQSSAVGRLL